MGTDSIKSLLKCIQDSGLKWDLMEEAETLADDPAKFKIFFTKVHSKAVCDIVFGCEIHKLPTYLSCGDAWLEIVSKWRLCQV